MHYLLFIQPKPYLLFTTEMSSAGNPSSSSAASPTWANTSGPLRPSVEDHTGGGTGMDELLQPVSTLDEPVKETIMRDVRAVGAKLRAVLIPLDRSVSSAQLSSDICNRVTLLTNHYILTYPIKKSSNNRVHLAMSVCYKKKT